MEGKSDAYCHTRVNTKRLPTHNVIYFIVHGIKKNGTIYRRFLFGPSLIVRLFPRRFFHGPIHGG